jgi:hypothetical protein
VLLRDPLVQVLPLEIGELSGEEPAISFNVSPMAQHFGRAVVNHRRHLLEMVRNCPSGGGGEFAAVPDSMDQ